MVIFGTQMLSQGGEVGGSSPTPGSACRGRKRHRVLRYGVASVAVAVGLVLLLQLGGSWLWAMAVMGRVIT